MAEAWPPGRQQPPAPEAGRATCSAARPEEDERYTAYCQEILRSVPASCAQLRRRALLTLPWALMCAGLVATSHLMGTLGPAVLAGGCAALALLAPVALYGLLRPLILRRLTPTAVVERMCLPYERWTQATEVIDSLGSPRPRLDARYLRHCVKRLACVPRKRRLLRQVRSGLALAFVITVPTFVLASRFAYEAHHGPASSEAWAVIWTLCIYAMVFEIAFLVIALTPPTFDLKDEGGRWASRAPVEDVAHHCLDYDRWAQGQSEARARAHRARDRRHRACPNPSWNFSPIRSEPYPLAHRERP